jgi:hypothetical protein
MKEASLVPTLGIAGGGGGGGNNSLALESGNDVAGEGKEAEGVGTENEPEVDGTDKGVGTENEAGAGGIGNGAGENEDCAGGGNGGNDPEEEDDEEPISLNAESEGENVSSNLSAGPINRVMSSIICTLLLKSRLICRNSCPIKSSSTVATP